MAVTKYKQVLLQGTRDIMTGLRRVPLQSLDIPTNQINRLHQVHGKENAIKYLYAAAFSQVQYTWVKSVNRGYFNRWTGLTSKYIHRMTKFEVTIKFHLAQRRKTPDKQQPTRSVEKTRGTQIQSKNQITTR